MTTQLNNNNNTERIRLIPDVNSDEFQNNYIRNGLLNMYKP